MINGDAVLISDNQIAQRLLNLRELVVKENKDNWLIALKFDYEHEAKIVNKNHPKHKQIVKFINISLEHGIESKWNNLFKHGMLVMVVRPDNFTNNFIFNLMMILFYFILFYLLYSILFCFILF